MKKKKIIILGGGMVGGAIAGDLCNEPASTAVSAGRFDVTVLDQNVKRLDYIKTRYPVNTIVRDFMIRPEINEMIRDFDLVISAVPGSIGYKILNAVITAEKDVVDISFFNHDPFELDELARTMNVTAVVDCGIAPGLNNILLGYHNEQMKVENFKCYVGGLPIKRSWPYEYKACFSPSDVIEEYVRPARLVSAGKLIIKEALSDPELIDFDEVGTLEAFNTDGLRTLITTMKIPNMVEKTLRYPGHIELMKIFRESGFFSTEELKLNSKSIRPLELTSELLFKQWKPDEEENEFTIMKIIISGLKDGKWMDYTYNIFDRYNAETKTSSMARTTGYTCTAVARLLLDGSLQKKGILPPEHIGAIPGIKDKIFKMFEERKINIKLTVSEKFI